jgi:Zn-dependent peptidase ImmA (M78 family)
MLGQEPTWPISDDDLEFVADMASSFDIGRDMSELGLDVDAVTIFSSTGPPVIALSHSLLAPNMRLRRRMTIAHELGHVVLHHPMYRVNALQLNLLGTSLKVPAYCQKAMTVAAVDWVEWQANFFGGALLAPKAELLRIVRDTFGTERALHEGSIEAGTAVRRIAEELDISRDAARVRLAQVGSLKPKGDDLLSESHNF